MHHSAEYGLNKYTIWSTFLIFLFVKFTSVYSIQKKHIFLCLNYETGLVDIQVLNKYCI
jgi:hypothetical protein